MDKKKKVNEKTERKYEEEQRKWRIVEFRNEGTGKEELKGQ